MAVVARDLRLIVRLRIWNRNWHYHSFRFRWLSLLAVYILLVSGIGGMGFILQLKLRYIVILCLCGGLGLMIVFSWMMVFQRNQHVFTQFTTLVLHLCSHFKISSKTVLALNNTKSVLDDEFQATIDDAIAHLHAGETYRLSFDSFPSHFTFYSLVKLMEAVEVFGNDNLQAGLGIIEHDVDDWIDDTYDFVQQLIRFKNRVIVLCVMGLVVALISQRMLSGVVDITHMRLYQDIVFTHLMVTIICLIYGHRVLRHEWISNKECL